MYGELGELRGITPPGPFPVRPPGYNFMGPLGLDAPSAAIGPLVVCLYNSDVKHRLRSNLASRSVNYCTACQRVKAIIGLFHV